MTKAEKKIRKGEQAIMKQVLVQKQKMPEGWKVISLGEIGNFLRGPFGSSVQKSVCVLKGKYTYKLYEQGNVINNDFLRGDYYLTKEKFYQLEKFEIKTDDILMTCAGTLGKITIVPEGIEKGIINSVLMRIRLNQSLILNKYFIYLFKSPAFQNKVISQSSGAGIKNLFATKELKKYKIILPPLPVQQQIVAKLDAQMAQIEIMKKEAEKEKEASEDMLNSFLDEIVFSDLIDKYEEIPLKKILKVKGGFAFKSGEFSDEGIPVIKIANVTNKNIDWSEKSFLPKQYLKNYSNFKIEKGDILVGMTRPVTKSKVKVAVYEEEYPSLLNQRVGKLEYDSNKIYRDYLLYAVYSPRIRLEFEKKSSASQQPNISPAQIESIKIMLPPLEIQEEIIKKINNINLLFEIISLNINQKLSAISLLPSSILNEVFGKYKIPSN